MNNSNKINSYEKLQKRVEKMTEDSFEILTFPDSELQEDIDTAIPLTLCCDRDKGIVWLEINEYGISDSKELAYFKDICVSFGIRQCSNGEEWEALIRETKLSDYRDEYEEDEDEDEDESPTQKL